MRTALDTARRPRNWTEEEVAILRANLGKTDREIAREISALGRKRAVKAVGKKRREYEPAKSPSMGRKANDWPRVHGDIETQSKRFARALLEAMLAEHRARRLG